MMVETPPPVAPGAQSTLRGQSHVSKSWLQEEEEEEGEGERR